MSDYDPAELLTVLGAIIEDGELSYSELYQLAEWLNSHHEAFSHWPGNVLLEPLQKIWADGKITKTEARQMARLILQIRKEASKREAATTLGHATEAASQAARAFDLSRPHLPSIAFTVRIKSHTDKGTFYDVDLTKPTCTCPDFRGFRQRLPVGHLTRCCKHVFDAYSKLEPSCGWPGWLRAFFELAWTPHPEQDWLVLQIGTSLVLISSAPTGWANVFASNRGPYDRYGYNVFEDRWAYGIAPPNAERIRQAVVTFTNR